MCRIYFISVRRFQQHFINFKVEIKTIDINYLKQRTLKLSEDIKIVILLIDEVYTTED